MSDVARINLFDRTLVTGDEKALLKKHLHDVQQSLLWKVAGLSDEELRRPMTKTHTNLIGIVKHLVGVTSGYLCSSFGRPRENLPWEHDEELWHGLDMWATPEESCQEIIAMYRRACDAGMRSIDDLDLDSEGMHHIGVKVSLRWMILVVLMDTTRHTGHADVVREMIDGRVGGGPGDGMSVQDHDDAYLRMVGARRTGEIDRDAWLTYCGTARHRRPPPHSTRVLDCGWPRCAGAAEHSELTGARARGFRHSASCPPTSVRRARPDENRRVRLGPRA